MKLSGFQNINTFIPNDHCVHATCVPTDKWHNFKAQMLLCTKTSHSLTHSLIHAISALTNTPKLHNYYFSWGLFIVVMADAFWLWSVPISKNIRAVRSVTHPPFINGLHMFLRAARKVRQMDQLFSDCLGRVVI